MNVRKTVFAFLVLTFLVSSLFGKLMIANVKAVSNIICVDASNVADPEEDGSWEHPFDTIQEGVNAAGFGHVIQVRSGVYREYVQITKSSISLIAENGTIIDGGGTRNGIRIGGLPPAYAEHVSISGFTVQNCVKGIVLVRCRYACFRNVSMVGNAYNFADYSLQVNDIDISNTVNGRPIYYWVNEHGKQVPSDAGYVVLINCTNIVVKDLNLTKNGQGVVFKYTSNSFIQNVNVSGNWDGVYIEAYSSNNTIIDCTVTNNLLIGIYISNSWGNTVSNNRVSKNNYGVFLDESSNANIIVNNTITENEKGLYFYGENGNILSNVVRANTVSNNTVGISLLFSRDNIIYHNNFVNNSDQAYAFDSADRWDYNSEGNYWTDYAGEDLNSDGVGDTPYPINEDIWDSYPLMGSLSHFSIPWQEEAYDVLIVSDSNILELRFSQPEKMISLNVTGPDGGFCKVSLPIILLGGPYTILVDGSPPRSANQTSNGTHTFFYFTYEQGIRYVKIKGTTVIPEFSSLLMMFFFVMSLATILLRWRRIRVSAKNNGSEAHHAREISN